MNKIEKFKNLVRKIDSLNLDVDSLQTEKIVENILCTNLVHTFNEILDFYNNILSNNKSIIQKKSLLDLDKWKMNEYGQLVHDSKQFFKVIGISIESTYSREIGPAIWEQPIFEETTTDGGILGLIRTYINKLPHYLVEVKFEPGNYNFLQFSPTIQATFSNINRAHQGKIPNYYNFFQDYSSKSSNYLFNGWLSEDGGRLFNKRNLALVKQVDISNFTSLEENFIWISKFQINKLIQHDAIVNPHLLRLINL